MLEGTDFLQLVRPVESMAPQAVGCFSLLRLPTKGEALLPFHVSALILTLPAEITPILNYPSALIGVGCTMVCEQLMVMSQLECHG